MATGDTQLDREDPPYTSFAYPETHPDRLASVAHLLGLGTSPVEGARVLEIGCSAGGNLLPMADQLPHTRFVGFDVSPRAIGLGTTVMRAAGLRNVELFEADLRTFDPGGEFDYVICHGVLSWIGVDARSGLFSLIRRALTPRGVAYISYNVYPRWHLRHGIRDAFRLHTENIDDWRDQVRVGRAFLRDLAQAMGERQDAYARLVREEAELIERHDDTYLLSEYLLPNNHPLYFREFEALLRTVDLQYLGEADFSRMVENRLPPRAKELALEYGRTGVAAYEQYLDIVRGLGFRQSLAVRQGTVVQRNVSAERVRPLYVSAEVQQSIPTGSGRVRVSVARGPQLTLPDHLADVLALVGSAWPGEVAVGALEAQFAGPERSLTRDLLRLYSAGAIELRPRRLPIATRVEPTPRVSALARYCAANQLPLANLRHENVAVDGQARAILSLLDGSRTVADISRALDSDGPGAGAPPSMVGIDEVLELFHQRSLLQK